MDAACCLPRRLIEANRRPADLVPKKMPMSSFMCRFACPWLRAAIFTSSTSTMAARRCVITLIVIGALFGTICLVLFSFRCRTRPGRSAFNVRRLVARQRSAPASHRSAGEIEFLAFLLVHVLHAAEQKERTASGGTGWPATTSSTPTLRRLILSRVFLFPKSFCSRHRRVLWRLAPAPQFKG